MKKLYVISAVFVLLSSCSNSGTNDENKMENADSVGLTTPTSTDTTVKQPSGVDNSSAISTDTAAMNVQNTIKKADSLKAKK